MNNQLTKEQAERQIEELQNHIKSLPEECKYTIGARFTRSNGFGEVYVLAQSDVNTLVMINIRTGNRYTRPVTYPDLLSREIPQSIVKQLGADLQYTPK